MFSLLAAATALTFATVATAQDQTIQVGASQSSGNPFVFTPAAVNATTGSVITFNFSGIPGFHSVSQSTFASPCQQLSGGFDSGFVEIGLTGTPAAIPMWNLTITNQSQPIWFYCKQLAPQPHCIAGMVGGINVAGAGQFSLSAFQQAARSSSGTPGQQQGNLVGLGASASAPPSPLTVAGVTGVANPTAGSGASGASATTSGASAASTGASASGGSSTAPSPSSSSSSSGTTSGARSLSVDALVVLAASFAGMALAQISH